WAGNYFRGERGDDLVVADTDGRCAGFLLALHVGDALVIDLVAVDDRWRGRGLVGDMTRLACLRRAGARVLRVGTQVANIPALRAYIRLGFTVVQCRYVLHFHLEAERPCRSVMST
ncbi:MAG: GNAT family N-acetyltransferase, partial [Planctomycetota bacterium]